MSKKRIFVLVGVVVIFFMAGSAMAAKINIDVNCTMKPGGSEEAGIAKFKEVVEEKSNSRMQVRMFMSGQLGKEKAVLELMKIGQTQMALTGGLFLSMFAKEYDPVSIPFYMPTWECVKAYLEGPMLQKINELAMQKGGIIEFGPQKRAPRHMISNRKVMGPEDIKGLKMRVPAMPIWVSVWKELGALPTVVPATEIYLALKTGQCEASENTLASPYTRKLYEIMKYIILTSHIYFPWHWVGSQVWFEKLDAGDQKIIRDAVEVARAHGEQAENEKDSFYVTELKKFGMEFITPNVAGIRQAAMPAIQRAISNLAPEVAEEVEKVCK